MALVFRGMPLPVITPRTAGSAGIRRTYGHRIGWEAPVTGG
ncbi:hypothetical protein QLX52_27585 [Streptomyces albus]|nr:MULTISPECIES: hypothetical protein [Streptomyces]MDI6412570.1 hypothetical protein [Streptomyces albus]